MSETGEYLTVSEAADRVGVAIQTIRQHYRRGDLTPHVRGTARDIYISAQELDELYRIRPRTTPAKEKA